MEMQTMKRLNSILAVGVAVAILGGLAKPAAAGTWKIVYEVSGNIARGGDNLSIADHNHLFSPRTVESGVDDKGRSACRITPTKNGVPYNVLNFYIKEAVGTGRVLSSDSVTLTATPILIWSRTSVDEPVPQYAVAWIESVVGIKGTGMGQPDAEIEADAGPDSVTSEIVTSGNVGNKSGQRNSIGKRLYVSKVPPIPASHTHHPNNPEYRLPTITLKGKFKTLFQNGGLAELTMRIHTFPWFDMEPTAYNRGAAVTPCPMPPSTILNQLVLSGDRDRLNLLPVGIRFQIGSASNILHIQQSSSWKWRRPSAARSIHASTLPIFAPHSVEPGVITNPLFPGNGMYWDPARQFTVGPKTDVPNLLLGPQHHRGFVFGDLPTDNKYFGEYEVEHYVADNPVLKAAGGGKLIGVSPVGLFYDANDRWRGTPPLKHKEPNWFYYYGKYWETVGGTPWGAKIEFGGGTGSLWPDPTIVLGLTINDPPIKLGEDAHGKQNRELSNLDNSANTTLWGYPPGSTDLQIVGAQTVRGIDNYVRVVTHEAVHRRLYALVHEYNLVDEDEYYDDQITELPVQTETGDGVPDEIERNIGLDDRNCDTMDWGAPGSNYGPDRGDNEVFARMCERDIFAQNGEKFDWASDGINYGTISPPNRCERQLLEMDPTRPKEQWGETKAERNQNFYNACTFPDPLLILQRAYDYH